MVDLMNEITIEIICEDGDDKLACNAMYTWSDSYMTCTINTLNSFTYTSPCIVQPSGYYNSFKHIINYNQFKLINYKIHFILNSLYSIIKAKFI